MRKRSFAIRAR